MLRPVIPKSPSAARRIAAPPLSPKPSVVVVEGPLGIFKKFRYKERYLQVVDGLLKIYRRAPSSTGPSTSAPRITASIATMTWSTGGSSERCFSVDTGRQILVLRAASEAERNKWLKALELERSILPCIGGQASLHDAVGRARAAMPWPAEVGAYRLVSEAIESGGFAKVCAACSVSEGLAARVLVELISLFLLPICCTVA